MKIVYFNYLYDLYGISVGSTRKAENLMSDLSKLGNEVKIYWLKKQPKNNTKFRKQDNSFFKRLLSKYLHDLKQLLLNFKYIIKEFRIIAVEQPDLIISRLELYLFSSLLLSKLMKIPIIIEADAPCVYELKEFSKEFWRIPWLAGFIERLNLKKADISVCVSNAAKQYFIDQGVPEHKLVVITNGADIDKFHPLVDKTPILKKDISGKTVVGFVGSFHFWHGIENLIEVIKKTIQAYQNTIFLLVGEGGPMKQKLEHVVKHEGLQRLVILAGYISYEDIPEYISAMDIVLAPYPKLKFFYYSPVKIFEYMSSGKPVITTNIGQISEVIKNGYNGFLTEPDNIEQILSKLLELLVNPELRSSIGKNARETIIANHTWMKKASQLSEICNNVVNKHKHLKYE